MIDAAATLCVRLLFVAVAFLLLAAACTPPASGAASISGPSTSTRTFDYDVSAGAKTPLAAPRGAAFRGYDIPRESSRCARPLWAVVLPQRDDSAAWQTKPERSQTSRCRSCALSGRSRNR